MALPESGTNHPRELRGRALGPLARLHESLLCSVDSGVVEVEADRKLGLTGLLLIVLREGLAGLSCTYGLVSRTARPRLRFCQPGHAFGYQETQLRPDLGWKPALRSNSGRPRRNVSRRETHYLPSPQKRSHPQFGLLIAGSALEARSQTPAGRDDYAFRYPSWRQVREKAAQQQRACL